MTKMNDHEESVSYRNYRRLGTKDQARVIKELQHRNELIYELQQLTLKKISERYGVSHSSIWRISRDHPEVIAHAEEMGLIRGTISGTARSSSIMANRYNRT